jgi:hypothetical protein
MSSSPLRYVQNRVPQKTSRKQTTSCLRSKLARAHAHTHTLSLSQRDRRRRYLLRNSRGVPGGGGGARSGARRRLQNLVILLLHFPQFSSCFNWSHVPSSTCSFLICSCAFLLLLFLVQELTEFFFLSLETIFVLFVVVLIFIVYFCFNFCVWFVDLSFWFC